MAIAWRQKWLWKWPIVRKTVKLIGIMVLFVFLDSESILGLYFEKKCSEIVSFFFWMSAEYWARIEVSPFFVSYFLSSKKVSSIMFSQAVFCLFTFLITICGVWRGRVRVTYVKKGNFGTLLLETRRKSKESPGKITAATKKNKTKTSTTAKMKEICACVQEKFPEHLFSINARNWAQYLWTQLKAQSYFKNKKTKNKQNKLWKVPKISILYVFCNF